MTAQARLLAGRYQVGELLGYGGMAEVHRGRDLRLGRDVAIKMLRTDLARDKTFQERFRREAQNAASLNHPAIVAVYDTGEDYTPSGETVPFIVMEFVNGRTLKEILAAEGRLAPRRALEIVADICAALEFSHRHQIIHRDIKPGNVMLTHSGQVKVMDFGIARALASGATTMTQTSAVIGTAQYLSPEQARGEAVDARSDVYASGCVLFELLCGHPPFVGDNPVSVAYQHVRENPRPPSEINPEVTPEIDAIVLKALAKNPLNRYQSAAEMRADLLRCLNGRPVLATPVLRDQETMPMAAAPAAATRTQPMTRALPPEQLSKRKRSPWVVATGSAVAVLAVIALASGLIYALNQPKGPAKVDLPSFIGQPATVAEQQLRALNLIPATTSVKDDCTVGQVMSQEPPAGKVEEGSTVTLGVCAGPDTVTVPTNLVGSTRQLAEERLRELGLDPEIEYVDSDQPRDTVVRVEKAGQSVRKGEEITVEVSKANLSVVPEVVGTTVDVAIDRLRRAGFEVEQRPGDEVPAGSVPTVTSQSVAPGQKYPKGSVIAITVTQPRQHEEPDEPTPDPSASVTPTTTPTTSPPTSGRP
ncbi:MAG TPA: Stk1 family PASTA domain-containing Ser/Thr kinase [Micromonospora sp.]